MFMIVGMGQCTRERLIDLLREWGFMEPSPVVEKIEAYGKATINNNRIMVVR